MEVREWREENGGQGIFEKIIYLVLVKISPCLFCTESVRNIVVSIICSCKKKSYIKKKHVEKDREAENHAREIYRRKRIS